MTGEDFGRAIRESRESDSRRGSIIWTAFDKIFILAHTRGQIDLFTRNYRMPREKIHIVTHADMMRGYGVGSKIVLFLLPDWTRRPEQHGMLRSLATMVDMWRSHYKFPVVSLTDAQVEMRAKDNPAKY